LKHLPIPAPPGTICISSATWIFVSQRFYPQYTISIPVFKLWCVNKIHHSVSRVTAEDTLYPKRVAVKLRLSGGMLKRHLYKGQTTFWTQMAL